MIQGVRIDTIMKDLKNAINIIFKINFLFNIYKINKYDNILLESAIYSRIIGINARFKTFHEFMNNKIIDFVLINISQLNTFKEKNNMDFKAYKKKIETLSQN